MGDSNETEIPYGQMVAESKISLKKNAGLTGGYNVYQ